jgi:hypothetical protein
MVAMRSSRLAARVLSIPIALLFGPALSFGQTAAAAPAAPPATDADAPPPAPKPAPPGKAEFVSGDWKFGIHGIAGASFYVQDTPAFVFNGQGPLLALSKPADGFTTGADVRQTRLNLSLAGPKILGGATPKSVVEIDFFGLNGTGGYGEVSVLPRLRLAYAELAWGNDMIRVGQDYELILGLIPEGMGHMAYPVTYFNGLIGWREPGVTYFHTIPMDTSKLELAVSVLKSDWQNPADFGLPNTNDLNVDLGQLSGLPGVEARIKYQSPAVMFFVAGHYNKVMGTHAGDLIVAPSAATANINILGGSAPTRNWDVYAATAGLKVTVAGFTLGVNGYYGSNLGPFLGEQLQFATGNDIKEFGGWGELGYDLTEHLNVFAIGGTSQLNQTDLQVAGGGRLSSSVIGGMVRYQEKGFAFGPEFYHVIAKDIDATGKGAAAGPGALNGEIDVNQAMLSGMYFF